MTRFVPGMRVTDGRNLARVLADNEAPVYVGGIGDGAVPDMSDVDTISLVMWQVLDRYPEADIYQDGDRWCVEHTGDSPENPSRAWYGETSALAWLAAWRSL